MTIAMKEQRSTIDCDTIQEQVDQEVSAEWSTLQNRQQYFTPPWLVDKIGKALHAHGLASYNYVVDPQCGDGNLLRIGKHLGWQYRPYYRGTRIGWDLDKRELSDQPGFDGSKIIGSCLDVDKWLTAAWNNHFGVDESKPEHDRLRIDNGPIFSHVVCNPPFAKKWKVEGSDKSVDSTEWTWDWATKRAKVVVMISNHKTLERLGYNKDPNTVQYWTEPGCWDNCDVVVGVVIWKNPRQTRDNGYFSLHIWNRMQEIAREEAANRPKHNVYLTAGGRLKVYLSRLTQTRFKMSREDVLRLNSINDAHPLALVAERETRTVLKDYVTSGKYIIAPDAEQAIKDALAACEEQACPVMEPTEFMMSAYADEEEALECVNPDGLNLTKGKRYTLSSGTYTFNQRFTRRKPFYNEETGETGQMDHECSLTGQDRFIQIEDDKGKKIQFRRHTEDNHRWILHEERLFTVFKKPEVKSMRHRYPEKYQHNMDMLSTCETFGGFEYYPGQKDYLARVGIKDHGLIGADVGTGKSLMTISLISMKAPKRTLICAPQGTIRSEDGDDDDGQEYNPSQWVAEIRKFAPFMHVFELFSMDDYWRILRANGGTLPHGVYITYYQALTQNKSRESVPSSWDDIRLEQEMAHTLGIKLPSLPKDKRPIDKKTGKELPYLRMLEPYEDGDPSGWAKRVGEESHGVRCIITPNMVTQIGHWFDCVCLDEIHVACNLDSLTTRALIRLQPKYRYGFSATPIPNRVDNMFSLLGWLCVPDWYKGEARNAAWPYARGDIGRFQKTFLTEERDFTRESQRRQKNPRWNGKCTNTSPVIASPARLLKIISPTLAFIDKKRCNPDLVPLTVKDVRVDMGLQQAKLYGHFLQKGNIPGIHPLAIARKQTAYLRGICADPKHFPLMKRSTAPVELLQELQVKSNMNPKILATIKLILELNAKGEQVVVCSSRVGISDTLADLLETARIPYSRIDSTVQPLQHATQSNLFKKKETQVMLMGIKCAVGHSFDECPNEIITSLEWSYGSKAQAEGRVYRVNSKRPVNIWCILCRDTIEELMFDKVATKKDAATICLHGERVPAEFKPIDMNELIAESGDRFNIRAAKDEVTVEHEIYKLLAK